MNDVGPGAGSNTPSQATPGPPDQVGGLRVTGGNQRIDASWSAPNGNGEPVQRYEWQWDCRCGAIGRRLHDGPVGVVDRHGRLGAVLGARARRERRRVGSVERLGGRHHRPAASAR